MNCEHVFEVLTRGPFPTGEPSDAAVERHLLACHECRQLAEALRPAVALFHESFESDELSQLPAYRGRLNVPSVERTSGGPVDGGQSDTQVGSALDGIFPVQFSAAKRRALLETPAGGWRSGSSAALLAGVLLTLLLVWQWNVAGQPPHAAGDVSEASDRLRPIPDAPGEMLLASLGLPADCRDADLLIERRQSGQAITGLADAPTSGVRTHPDRSEPNSVHPGLSLLTETYLCCTHCHVAGSPGPSTLRTVAATVRSCEACHATDERPSIAARQSQL